MHSIEPLKQTNNNGVVSFSQRTKRQSGACNVILTLTNAPPRCSLGVFLPSSRGSFFLPPSWGQENARATDASLSAQPGGIFNRETPYKPRKADNVPPTLPLVAAHECIRGKCIHAPNRAGTPKSYGYRWLFRK